jgi:Zn-dependent peptidase ImmA (M78 family)/transcriptional regulator with XRE-family HTH domain
MSIDQTTLATRLRKAREQTGITQEKAADSLQLPRTALVQIENAHRTVSSLELARMSKLYRRDMADFFADEMPETAECPAVVLYRLREELEKDPQIRSEVERCIDICCAGAELEEILELPKRCGPPLYQMPAPTTVMQAVLQGQQAAKSERQRLQLDDNPIPDMSDLLNNQCGIWASGVHLPDSMSGLFLADERFGFVVLVNFGHPRGRKRFSYAHEYAHTLFDRDKQAEVTDRNNAKDLRETRANAFAASFLMPEAGVQCFVRDLSKAQPSRQETPVFDSANNEWTEASIRPPVGSQTLGYQDAALVADHFRVSYQAAVYRLRSLQLVNSDERDGLLKQEKEAVEYMRFLGLFDFEETPNLGGEEDPEKQPDRELVAQVAHLTIEAYKQESISRGRVLEIATMLRRDGKDLLRFAQASKKE